MRIGIIIVLVCAGCGQRTQELTRPTPTAENLSGAWVSQPGYTVYRIDIDQSGSTIAGRGQMSTCVTQGVPFSVSGTRTGDVVNLVFTFVAIYTVDRLGRRVLMLIGAGGLAGIYAILGTGYYLHSTGIHMLVLVVLAIACYSMSLAPITWVVISEIFPNRIRGAAVSAAVFSLWVACTVLTLTFPWLKGHLGAHGTFWLYGVICVVGFVVIWRRLPETKGKSLEAIERELVD